MYCPYCRYPDSRVVDSRTSDDGVAIRRRRQCPECGRRFSTTETASLNVIKRSGVVVPFSREKIMNGVRKACQGRPVTDSDLAVLAQRVEETVRSTGAAQIEANDIGLAILQPLRELDEVAYLRFASVYQAFDSLDDFEAAITLLRMEHGAGAADDGGAGTAGGAAGSAEGHAGGSAAPAAGAAKGRPGDAS
ncbi:transcriptional regulator NrdR [Subtercola sp. YIM 133946]|uniref:transcriptional regulator NrdR n=1 Tax=Subtercola sp. YIM 133946 TaxID=3118909 RepID=UPI002F948987